MKVLLGVDGSPDSLYAVKYVGQLLTPQHDELVFYYVPPAMKVSGSTTSDVAKRATASLAQAVFQESFKALPAGWNDRVSNLVGTQWPGRGLIVAADEVRANLIVVGAKGMSLLERFMLGSISNAVVHHSTIPVLVVRKHKDLPPDALTVLLACDGSEHSQHAAEFLNQFTWPPGSHGELVAVVESKFLGQVPAWLAEQALTDETEAWAHAWAENHEHEKLSKEHALKDYCQHLSPLFADAKPHLADGQAATEILHTAGQLAADLIVVGARGKQSWQRLLLGGTSDKVLTHAACSVLVVPQHEAA